MLYRALSLGLYLHCSTIMQIPIPPISLAILLITLFPAPTVHPEPTVSYQQLKPMKSITLPKMPEYKAITYQPFPVAPQGTYVNTYAFGNCTWYVAGRKKVPESWGNAADWAVNAQAQGVTVSNVPMAGAIAQRTGGLGHVAIVLEFTGTMVHIIEMNSAGFDVVDDRWMPIATYNYIYI